MLLMKKLEEVTVVADQAKTSTKSCLVHISNGLIHVVFYVVKKLATNVIHFPQIRTADSAHTGSMQV